MPKLKIALVPIDNRPVCYDLPIQIASLNNKIKVFVPPKEFIGNLIRNSDTKNILLWLDEILLTENISYIACSLDTIAYGGLIPSRRSNYSQKFIISQVNEFFNIAQKYNAKIYAFSSIMRISNNNINEEEKEYWDKYGELIFKYSFLNNKISKNPLESDVIELQNIQTLIPPDILDDYILTRKRNFEVNKYYLECSQNNIIDYLVFSQDDTAQYGFNVEESNILKSLIKEKSKVTVQTGADEIPCDLISRIITASYKEKISIYPIFSTENGKNVISRYEDRTILESVKGHIILCGAEIALTKEDADLIILVHTPINKQNDHCMKDYPESENKEAIEFGLNIINNVEKPVIVADISCANGADNIFVQKILAQGINFSNFYGYAAWNTTGNTLGTAVSIGLSRYIAEKENVFNGQEFKKLILIRLSDDWAYQTVARQKIRALTSDADIEILNEELYPYIQNIAKKIDFTSSEINLSFPWDRTFEVGIKID